MLVDLPGYGYRQAPKATVQALDSALVEALPARPPAAAPGLPADRLPATASRTSTAAFMAMLDEAAVSYQVVLTKADKIRRASCADRSRRVRRRARQRMPPPIPSIIATSARDRRAASPSCAPTPGRARRRPGRP